MRAKAPQPVTGRVIVLDSAALIAGTDSLYALGGLVDPTTGAALTPPAAGERVTFYTTPDVVTEVRDARARARLALLQGAVVLRAPSAESLAAVIACAKITGDFSVLSAADLRVMALCHMLEREKNGLRFLSERPEALEYSELRLAKGISFEEMDRRECAQRELAEKEALEDDGWTTVEKPVRQVPKKNGGKKKKKKKKNGAKKQDGEEHMENDLVSGTAETLTDALAETTAELEITAHAESEPAMPPTEGSGVTEEAPVTTSSFYAVDTGSDVEDGGGWINEDNLEEHLARDGGEEAMSQDDQERVGCVTTDFAMQNTMLQMGLKLLSVDGRRTIRQIKHFALRCHSCGAVSRELERKFCEKCGNATMHRVAFRVNKKGIARIFMNPKKKPVLRGSKYPIPMPRGGRHNKDLVLCEDQVDPVKQRRLAKQQAKLNVDVLDPSNFYNAGARFNPHDGPMVVGYGRRNPNEVRPTSRSKRK